jgi:Rrf2 family transcriptional regulator, cysteine metabolism repressor
MNVSVKCEYALRAVLDLTLATPTQPVRIADIAQRQKIPQKFLETILADLKKQGFLESRRGAEGGYLLARHPEQITVGEIVRAVEGGRTGRASLEPGAIAFFWNQLDEVIADIIDRTTFTDLARQWRDLQAQNAHNWEI